MNAFSHLLVHFPNVLKTDALKRTERLDYLYECTRQLLSSSVNDKLHYILKSSLTLLGRHAHLFNGFMVQDVNEIFSLLTITSRHKVLILFAESYPCFKSRVHLS